jgi:hypothetical protein
LGCTLGTSRTDGPTDTMKLMVDFLAIALQTRLLISLDYIKLNFSFFQNPFSFIRLMQLIMFINYTCNLNGGLWKRGFSLSLKFVTIGSCLFEKTVWPVRLELSYSFSFPSDFPEVCGFQSDLIIYMRYPFLCVSNVFVRKSVDRLL